MRTRMAICIGIVGMVIAGAGIGAEAGGKLHLFILSGQSNMAGLDPNVSFTPAVKAAFSNDTVLVVKDAASGQPIMRWYKNWKAPGGAEVAGARGDLYDRMMTKVNAALEGRKPATVSFVWMQGERDAKMGWQAVYADSLRGLLAQLQADLKHQDINMVIGRISDNGNGRPGWDAVRKIEVEVAESLPRGRWVDTDDLNGPNNDLHYDSQGYAELGKRFAEKAIALINGTK